MITFAETHQNITGDGGGCGEGAWYGDGKFYQIILQIHGSMYGAYYGHENGNGFGNGRNCCDHVFGESSIFRLMPKKYYPHNLIIL